MTNRRPKMIKQRLAMIVPLSPYSLPEGERDVVSLRECHVHPLPERN